MQSKAHMLRFLVRSCMRSLVIVKYAASMFWLHAFITNINDASGMGKFASFMQWRQRSEEPGSIK
jgi:hypothetical protein